MLPLGLDIIKNLTLLKKSQIKSHVVPVKVKEKLID